LIGNLRNRLILHLPVLSALLIFDMKTETGESRAGVPSVLLSSGIMGYRKEFNTFAALNSNRFADARISRYTPIRFRRSSIPYEVLWWPASWSKLRSRVISFPTRIQLVP
jgi:hypothetical protein